MKRGLRRIRAYEDEDGYYIQDGMGTVSVMEGDVQPDGNPQVLWVPDLECQHGWRGFYVYPAEEVVEDPGFGFVRNR